jgi:hypothetical protein
MSGVTTRHALPTLLAAATLLLAACGGSSGEDPTAAEARNDANREAFFECLRKAGVTVNERNGSADIRVPQGISEARMGRIEQDCRRKTGGGGGGRELSASEKSRFLDQALKFAQCLRAHGVAISDPTPHGRGITMRSTGSTKLDPSSPVFRRAAQACESLNPKGASRKPPGGGGK